MQLFVLLNDHEGLAHRKIDLELDEQTTLRQLKKTISLRLNIDPDSQNLYFDDGREICGIDLNSQLPQIGLRHLDKLIVKHSLLANWIEFCEYHKSAEKSKQQHRIKADVDAALQLLKFLQSHNFFLCYARLGSKIRLFSDQFAHYLDSNNTYIEYAANEYFSKLFHDSPEYPQIEIKCNPKENCGAQGGLICEVLKGNVALGKFHVKTHLDTATCSSNHTSPDLRELFVYRFLEIIKIGPEVHFLPNVHYSTFALYIATKDVTGFKRALEARSIISNECKIQLELLRRILYLTDLHSANYGLDSDMNLCIVDFQVDNHTKSANVGEYLQGDREERIR